MCTGIMNENKKEEEKNMAKYKNKQKIKNRWIKVSTKTVLFTSKKKKIK